MTNGVILKRINRETRLGRYFWLRINDEANPQMKKVLEKRALYHYNRAERMKKEA